MKYNIQVVLEAKNDVIRNIDISPNKSLEDLHYAIIDSLELNKQEIASFYMTNKKFELLNEIPIFKIDESEKDTIVMSEIKLESIFTNSDNQLLYIYDFLKMWRFLISFSNTSNTKSENTEVTRSIGKMPEEAPQIIFTSDKNNDLYNDNFDQFNESEY